MEDGVYEMEIGGVDHEDHTSPTGTSQTAPLADGSTFFTEVRFGSIESTDQGLRFETDNSSGRLRAGVLFDQDNQVTLGDLDTLSFDFTQTEQDAGSAATYSPAFRLIIDADGNLATTADRGELVFEYAYQSAGDVPSPGAVPIGTTVEANLASDDWVAWQAVQGPPSGNFAENSNMTTFNDWSDADGFTPPNPSSSHPSATALHFDADSLVLGFQIGLGSGGGSGVALVDNVQVGGVTYDFVV